MRFTYNGATYELEFQRAKRKRKLGGLTTYPATTVRIFKTQPGKLPGELVREATAGCSLADRFTLEKGRLAALRMVSLTLDRELKQAMWTAYLNRPRLSGTENHPRSVA